METVLTQKVKVNNVLNAKIAETYKTISNDISKKLKEKQNLEILAYIHENYQYLTISEMAKKLGLNTHHKVTGLFIHQNLNKNLIAKSEQELLTLISKNNNYTNSDGTEKEKVRTILANEVEKSGVVGKYLGLPFYTADFEKKILKMIPKMSFVGCEIERNTYLLREKYNRLHDFPMEMHNCKLIDIIEKSEANTFAHAFLDYMGGIHKFGAEIVKAMDKQIVEIGGTLSFTIQNAQRFGLEKNNSRFKRLNDCRSESTIMIDKFICDIKGNDYELLSNNYYKDNGHVGMNLVILKRIK